MSKNDVTGDRLVSKVSTESYRDNFDSIFKKQVDMRAIYYWADGTWCDLMDYPTYTHMSDDVAQLTVPFDWTEEQVENHVRAACSPG